MNGMNGMNESVVEEAGRCSPETLCDYTWYLSTFVDMVPPYFKPRQDFVLLVLEVCLRRVRGRREVRRDEAKSVVVTL